MSMELICSDATTRPNGDLNGGTLIVLPVSLIAQWQTELETKAPHLTVECYYGETAFSYEIRSADSKTIDELIEYDVVLTTMGKLQELTTSRSRDNRRSLVLNKIKWHRLMIDECQFLKNDTTVIAKAASAIDATHIWMLSGTPLTNKLDDLRGELSLLRIWPFTLGTASDAAWMDHFWTGFIKHPWDAKDEKSLPIIHNLMNAVSMRHSRLQVREADGSPLVDLPDRLEQFVSIKMEDENISSSDEFVCRWLEATAANLLNRLGRVDVRIMGQVLLLRQAASSGALLSLERVNEAQASLLSEEKVSNKKFEHPIKKIRRLDVRAATLECKRSLSSEEKADSLMFVELVQAASSKDPVSALGPCSYCTKPRLHPTYFSCGHSVCVDCCMALMDSEGCLTCPSCKVTINASGITEVILPSSESVKDDSSKSESARCPITLDSTSNDDINKLLSLENESTAPNNNKRSLEQSSAAKPAKTLVTYMNDNFDFQRDTTISHTLATLEECADPTLDGPGYIDFMVACREYPHVPPALVKHVLACHKSGHSSPKIDAVINALKKIREQSLEAKICIFSSFSGVLDEIESALNTVEYTVMLDQNSGAEVLLKEGQKVTQLATGLEGRIDRCLWDDRDGFKTSYAVIFGDGGESNELELTRQELAVKPTLVKHVPSKSIRLHRADEKLSENSSENRYKLNDSVQSRRPPVSSSELKVGYSVFVLPNDMTSVEIPGRIVSIRSDKKKGFLFDVQPEIRERGEVMNGIPASRLVDRGSDRWHSAVIKGIHSVFTPMEGTNQVNPYEKAIGYVRLDGHAGDGLKRGRILDVFRDDPMCSVCLLTKTAAGVGLNLTSANHVFILEPSIDAHDEMQSICRVHRIGQTRKVSVLKFFLEGSVEERILKRRQQRGELSVSVNEISGVSDENEEGSSEKQADAVATVSSSTVVSFDDLKLIVGVM